MSLVATVLRLWNCPIVMCVCMIVVTKLAESWGFDFYHMDLEYNEFFFRVENLYMFAHDHIEPIVDKCTMLHNLRQFRQHRCGRQNQFFTFFIPCLELLKLIDLLYFMVEVIVLQVEVKMREYLSIY